MVSLSSSTPAPQPSPDVVSRNLGDGSVLVHLPTNRIFELNETGARIWELLSERVTRDQIVDRLVGEFDISRDDASQALNELLEELSGKGLVR